MSEKVITANQPLVCDLCGHTIPEGCKCRIIRDDSMPFLTYFEHLNCPTGNAVTRLKHTPTKPKFCNCRPMPVLA